MSRALAKFRSRAMFTFVGGALVINPAFAQDAAPATGQQPQSQSQPTQLDAVQVTGIRNSLSQAMDIKRDSAGVVDAISAEDIGKFPDTNLAESLQRITGISIERRDGEGAQVTARGFGPSSTWSRSTVGRCRVPMHSVPLDRSPSAVSTAVPAPSTSRSWPPRPSMVSRSTRPARHRCPAVASVRRSTS